jgi:hypothetical protein
MRHVVGTYYGSRARRANGSKVAVANIEMSVSLAFLAFETLYYRLRPQGPSESMTNL